MYEAVHAHPDGDATVARLAATAAEYGYDGLVVRNHGDADASYDAAAIAAAYDIDVVPGVEVRADDAARASGLVGNHRARRDVVCVHGGSLNRFAVEQPAVDVLAHPMWDGDVNHVLARAAADNAVHLEFNLGPVLRRTGSPRVRAIRGLSKLRELVSTYDAPFVFTADASSHFQLRAPRELRAVGERLGFDRSTVDDGLAAWGEIAARNRERRSEGFIEPGVRIDDHEADG